MSSKSNDNGRAYEFICLNTLNKAISSIRQSRIIINSCYHAAERSWNSLDAAGQNILTRSAQSIIDTIFAMEPRILEDDGNVLELYIQKDERGEEADVRDIIIKRKEIIWEIGLSIKHNHMAVKHSRIAKHLDFGFKWYGIPCSQEYWNDVNPVFEFLQKEKDHNAMFCDMSSKEDDVYMPLLHAFMKEIAKQVELDNRIPKRLVEYLLSKYDFYKVISIDNKQITTIQSFNMYNTLNLSAKDVLPSIKVPLIKLPSTLLHIGLKPNSKTTVIMCFDNGWQFSFRIHNAEKYVATTLKFDIQIEGMPTDVNMKYNCRW